MPPLELPPMPTVAKKRWTYADYCRIPPDGKRHEIVDGVHHVSPAPTPRHQIVSAHLHFALTTAIERPGSGVVLAAPIDLHLGRGSIVQPDLVVVLTRNRHIIGKRKLTGAPDLVVEILSPGTSAYDRRTKRHRYARAGVREFWLCDPDAACIEQFVLRDGAYVLIDTATESIRPRVLRGITIDLAEVF